MSYECNYMKNKNFIFEELKEISPLIAQIRKTNVYAVSSFYFNNLSSEIIKKIKLAKKSLSNLSPVTPYRIPAGYFESLPSMVFKKIYFNQEHLNEVFEEIEAIAPLLNTISKKPVYNIPANFFEKRQMPYTEVKKQKAKVVSVFNLSKILRLSAAAAIILFSTVGLYTITKKNDAVDNTRTDVKKLTKEEIVHFLKSNTQTENITSTTKHKLKNENKIKSSLKEISDQEIQQFLIKTGEADEI